ncbi:hypothetical protein NVP1091O_66 [Vibrio phage 1.091.O._10N.286.52.B12]|nr:hypothetical protein NVP1091O_66 [Vibrio phage 1.091.O._10N.286.52.B12]
MNPIGELRERYGGVLMAFEKLVTSVDDLHEVSGYAHDHFEQGGGTLKVKITNSGKRSLSQNSFQHVCYQEISKYLVAKGRNEWTPEFVKKNLKNKMLGWKTEAFVDVRTGERRDIWTLKSSSKLDKGEAMNYITEILDWAESIGCHIKVPEDSEYMKLMQSQNM